MSVPTAVIYRISARTLFCAWYPTTVGRPTSRGQERPPLPHVAVVTMNAPGETEVAEVGDESEIVQ